MPTLRQILPGNRQYRQQMLTETEEMMQYSDAFGGRYNDYFMAEIKQSPTFLGLGAAVVSWFLCLLLATVVALAWTAAAPVIMIIMLAAIPVCYLGARAGAIGDLQKSMARRLDNFNDVQPALMPIYANENSQRNEIISRYRKDRVENRDRMVWGVDTAAEEDTVIIRLWEYIAENEYYTNSDGCFQAGLEQFYTTIVPSYTEYAWDTTGVYRKIECYHLECRVLHRRCVATLTVPDSDLSAQWLQLQRMKQVSEKIMHQWQEEFYPTVVKAIDKAAVASVDASDEPVIASLQAEVHARLLNEALTSDNSQLQQELLSNDEPRQLSD